MSPPLRYRRQWSGAEEAPCNGVGGGFVRVRGLLSRAIATVVIVSVVAASFVDAPTPAAVAPAAATGATTAAENPDEGLTEMPGLRTLTSKTFSTATAGRYLTRTF